jgi:hypothetical protein
MYVHHSVHINQPVAECSAALAREPRTWFPHLHADNASDVGLRVAGVPVHKRVIVQIGEAETQGDSTNMPISWRATYPEHLFPILLGRLELVPVDTKVTRLTVSGMYEAPLGRLGALIDGAIMHGVAEATLREVTESIAKHLDRN